jgi:hypothetical protein
MTSIRKIGRLLPVPSGVLMFPVMPQTGRGHQSCGLSPGSSGRYTRRQSLGSLPWMPSRIPPETLGNAGELRPCLPL